MKIYLADTIQRDYLGHITKLGGQWHLESYFAIIKNKTDIKKLSIFKNEDNENIYSGSNDALH